MNNSNNISVTRVENIQQFESLREEWNTLLFQCPDRDIFLTWEWLFAWWKNLGQHDNALWLLLIYEADKLIGIAPLMLGQKNSVLIFDGLETLVIRIAILVESLLLMEARL
ncbi:MAG: hypothetical protein HC797_00780 [Anaerolineales bacterium]|nr:hypothetical protein [Anaerolineales bacterium]